MEKEMITFSSQQNYSAMLSSHVCLHEGICISYLDHSCFDQPYPIAGLLQKIVDTGESNDFFRFSIILSCIFSYHHHRMMTSLEGGINRIA